MPPLKSTSSVRTLTAIFSCLKFFISSLFAFLPLISGVFSAYIADTQAGRFHEFLRHTNLIYSDEEETVVKLLRIVDLSKVTPANFNHNAERMGSLFTKLPSSAEDYRRFESGVTTARNPSGSCVRTSPSSSSCTSGGSSYPGTSIPVMVSRDSSWYKTRSNGTDLTKVPFSPKATPPIPPEALGIASYTGYSPVSYSFSGSVFPPPIVYSVDNNEPVDDASGLAGAILKGSSSSHSAPPSHMGANEQDRQERGAREAPEWLRSEYEAKAASDALKNPKEARNGLRSDAGASHARACLERHIQEQNRGFFMDNSSDGVSFHGLGSGRSAKRETPAWKKWVFKTLGRTCKCLEEHEDDDDGLPVRGLTDSSLVGHGNQYREGNSVQTTKFALGNGMSTSLCGSTSNSHVGATGSSHASINSLETCGTGKPSSHAASTEQAAGIDRDRDPTRTRSSSKRKNFSSQGSGLGGHFLHSQGSRSPRSGRSSSRGNNDGTDEESTPTPSTLNTPSLNIVPSTPPRIGSKRLPLRIGKRNTSIMNMSFPISVIPIKSRKSFSSPSILAGRLKRMFFERSVTVRKIEEEEENSLYRKFVNLLCPLMEETHHLQKDLKILKPVLGLNRRRTLNALKNGGCSVGCTTSRAIENPCQKYRNADDSSDHGSSDDEPNDKFLHIEVMQPGAQIRIPNSVMSIHENALKIGPSREELESRGDKDYSSYSSKKTSYSNRPMLSIYIAAVEIKYIGGQRAHSGLAGGTTGVGSDGLSVTTFPLLTTGTELENYAGLKILDYIQGEVEVLTIEEDGAREDKPVTNPHNNLGSIRMRFVEKIDGGLVEIKILFRDVFERQLSH